MDIRWGLHDGAEPGGGAPHRPRARAQGLAACVNAIPGMRSVYLWEGKIEEASEAVLVAKTTAERMEELSAAVKRLHPYECPCILGLTVQEGFEPFLGWIRQSLRDRGRG